MNELFAKYKSEIESSLNDWMAENEYKEVKLTDEIAKDLMDEVFCFMTSNHDLAFVMDEIDKDQMLGEYDWCESTED